MHRLGLFINLIHYSTITLLAKFRGKSIGQLLEKLLGASLGKTRTMAWNVLPGVLNPGLTGVVVSALVDQTKSHIVQ